MSLSSPLLQWVGLLLLCLLLGWGAWWALFSDRPRGRRRCPRCWHDLTYTPGLRCGECGHEASAEAQLLRTRRRPLVALACLVGASVVGTGAIDRAAAAGWARAVPTRALLALVGWTGDPDGSMRVELDRRIRGGQLDEAQLVRVFLQAVQGDAFAQPPESSWLTRYADLAATAGDALLGSDDPELRALAQDELFALACRGTPEFRLVVRSPWPADAPLLVDGFVSDWWRHRLPIRITLVETEDRVPAQVFTRLDRDIQPRSFSFAGPALPEGRHTVRYAAEIERARDPAAPVWVAAGRTEISVTLEVTPGLALEPVAGPELDDAIRRAVAAGLVQYAGGGPMPVRIGLDRRATFIEPLQDTAVAIDLEIRRNGVPGRRLRTAWLAGPGVANRQHAWTVPWRDDAVLAPPATDADRWTVVVRSDPALALRVDGATRYWSGELETEVPIDVQETAAPSMGWTTGAVAEDGIHAPGDAAEPDRRRPRSPRR